MKDHIQQLKSVGACQEAVTWADQFSDMQAVWDNCERGDWLLWLLGRLSGEPESDKRKQVVFIAAQCAREVLPIFEKCYPDDKRVRECIEACEAYSRGEITMKELRAKRSAAYAAGDAYADDAADAAAAADAANAAVVAAAAGAAADAAYASAAAADAAARGKSMRKRCADIVRQHHPKAPEFANRKNDKE
jgi:hypothetical protein